MRLVRERGKYKAYPVWVTTQVVDKICIFVREVSEHLVSKTD